MSNYLSQEFANNLLVFIVYLIVVSLVFNKALQTLDKLVTVQIDSDYLNEQLTEHKLNDLITIKFPLAPSYKLEELKTLPIIIENKSQESNIDIDWKESYISDFDKPTRRLMRVIAGTTNVSQDGIKMLPGEAIKEQLSNENVAAPLFDPGKLKKAAQKGDRFSIRFILKVSEPGSSGRSCLFRCQFIAKKLPWQKALNLALEPK
ncbi:MAG TPA: hypothetical protein DD379_21910 [Cyanobacteria bacterium UBA11162]|nr:hypothetical protein [Cyanobacteria bacterium UBA12227]HAX85913.1 hypothetical protein [Cyanobacteria bacterium UBA11370]HBL13996.1 hypothetical protein [Cyanobacteria bacterium UBA11162]HBY75500.1 hypothetical protein [Cyanobacteria bacterium UBA11148]